MSRAKKFAHSLVTGYLLLGTNVFYTLASLPLALHYLSRPEFGLWVLTSQIAGYVAWIDLGMGSSISRILIDYKDQRDTGRYGGAIQSGILVGIAQGLITLVTGLSVVGFIAGWLRVPADLSPEFLWLMIGQVLLTAVSFVTRIFNQVLCAWQRMDVYNYSQIIQLVVGLAALWLGFHLGWGVYSLLWGTVAAWVLGTVFSFQACRRLGFWPGSGEWGRASRGHFRELFTYGADVFLIALGSQFIISSQTILVSRELGIEAAAVWSVMTKAFTLVSQVVWRMIGTAMPAFAEMQVRGETERLWNRYRTLFQTVNSVAGVAAVLFLACNGPFISLWTQGRFAWPAINNVLLGAWLIFSTQQCCHNSLIMTLKEIRGLKYVYPLEGILFVVVSLLVLRHAGLTGMLVCSLLATVLFTWVCGTWRVAGLGKTGLPPLVWEWQKPLLLVLAAMVPCWLAAEWLLHGQSDWLRLVLEGSLLAAVGGWVLLRHALPASFVVEMAGKLPGPLRRMVIVLAGQNCDGI